MVVTVCWLLYLVWQSQDRNSLAAYGAFALPMIMLAVGWVTWAWRRVTARPDDGSGDDQRLDRVADRLAAAVHVQWKQAAGERGLTGAEPILVTWGGPSLPLAGPPAAAADSRQFDPLPGLAPVGEPQLTAGQIGDLHALYGGVGSGRLVIAGQPGAGKSGAAVLLVLAALQHRERVPAMDRMKVPVPVLITAQDWDPLRQSVMKWLTKRLRETYPLFAGTAGAANAASLIATGKISLILDGLDEINADLRPDCLRALSE